MSIKPDYSSMTNKEFDNILRDVAHEHGTEFLLGIPGVYEIIREALNNDVLDEWAERNPDKAYPEEVT